jgi:dTDP-4-dehydrorhamnose 3,5-epimerase
MIVHATPTKIHLCQEIVLDVFSDHRGEYAETWNEAEYQPLINPPDSGKQNTKFVQDDVSISRKDTLRGLHGDDITWKLIQCLHGAFLLTVLDLRKDSPSFLQYQQWTLSEREHKQVLIPPGCVNGHLCLTESCVFSYKQTTYYQQQKQVTLRYDSFGIQWPVANPILSRRDDQARLYEKPGDYVPV